MSEGAGKKIDPKKKKIIIVCLVVFMLGVIFIYNSSMSTSEELVSNVEKPVEEQLVLEGNFEPVEFDIQSEKEKYASMTKSEIVEEAKNSISNKLEEQAAKARGGQQLIQSFQTDMLPGYDGEKITEKTPAFEIAKQNSEKNPSQIDETKPQSEKVSNVNAKKSTSISKPKETQQEDDDGWFRTVNTTTTSNSTAVDPGTKVLAEPSAGAKALAVVHGEYNIKAGEIVRLRLKEDLILAGGISLPRNSIINAITSAKQGRLIFEVKTYFDPSNQTETPIYLTAFGPDHLEGVPIPENEVNEAVVNTGEQVVGGVVSTATGGLYGVSNVVSGASQALKAKNNTRVLIQDGRKFYLKEIIKN